MDFLVYFLLVALVGASAFFSGMETALFSLQASRLKKHRDSVLVLALERVMQDRRRLLGVILLSDVLVNIPLVLLCLYLVQVLPFMPVLPIWLNSLALFTLVVLLCDLIPKMLALADPFLLARPAVWYLKLAMPVLGPICDVLQRTTERIAKVITPKNLNPTDALSEDEFATLMALGEETGIIDPQEREIIVEIMKLGDKTAKDCMTPRVDSFTLPDDLDNETAIAQLRTKRRRLVPVYGESPDEILGILDVATFLDNPTAHYTEMLIPPSFVSETMNALDLLKSFLHHPQRLAIVVDEYGGTGGVVTFSDIAEEVISDAVPLGTELYIEDLGNGRLIVSGHARLDDISEKLETPLKQNGLDTIGGYIFNALGHVPRPGFSMEIAGYTFRIRRATRKRIQEVFIEPTAKSSPEEENRANSAGEPAAP
ncbi:MAG TPA: hemolysin family protein [Chthoniobacterales bacterium]